MAEMTVCRKNAYYDSVTLMTLSSKLKKLPGIKDAVVSMATPMNKGLLENIGLLTGELVDAGPNDMAIALRGDTEENCQKALDSIEELLQAQSEDAEEAPDTFRTIAEASKNGNGYDLAVISVKGEFAAREAREALKRGMHVMLFSDNVSLEDEVMLKREAHEKGLLLMGPDCGTAEFGGVGLCFSNALRDGNIGLVGASGTGLQEITVLIDKFGGGISQVIGTGGRDLSEAVGGIMFLDGIDLLEGDKDTEVIVLVSKPPVPSVAQKVVNKASQCTKPVIICFIANAEQSESERLTFASSLEDAAYKAVALAQGEEFDEVSGSRFTCDKDAISTAASKLSDGQKYIRGLFCGGTLASEVFFEISKVFSNTFSNVSKHDETKMSDPFKSSDNCVVDLGDDVFTVGRAHPMIDPTVRCGRILQEAEDPECAVILLDFEIGYGSNADPVGETLDAIAQAHEVRAGMAGDVVFVAYVLGTDADEQGLQGQRDKLAEAGVILADSNLQAVAYALRIVEEKEAE